MASHGSRPQGTDGSDFSSREKIVPIYATIVSQKKRFYYAFLAHTILSIFMIINVVNPVMESTGVSIPFLPRFTLPDTHWWQFLWISSTLGMVMSWKALDSNSVTQMKIGVWITIVLGGVAAVVGLVRHFPGFAAYVTRRESSAFWLGKFPISLIMMGFLILAIIVQAVAVYYGWCLIGNWSRSGRRRKCD